MSKAVLQRIAGDVLSHLSARGLVDRGAGQATPKVANTNGSWCKIADVEDGIIDLWLDTYRSAGEPELYYGVWSSKRRRIEDLRSRFCDADECIVVTDRDEVEVDGGARRGPAVALDRSVADRTLGRFMTYTGQAGHNWFGRYAAGDPASDGMQEAVVFFDDVLSHDKRPRSEGFRTTELVSHYERDPALRVAALRIHGCSCSVCGFDFEKTYGSELGQGFIHVHHLVPLASEGEARMVDPRRDLRPVCPNCHAMLHRRTPPLDPDRLRGRLRR